jgi:HK97 family phage prohead protease
MKNKSFFPSTELRAYNKEEKEDRMVVGGYAIVFNSESRDLGGFTEFVSPNALDEALERNSDVLALYNHDYSNVLGRQSSETLQLYKDERGVRFELDLPDTTLGRDVYELVKRGDLKGNSFGFTVEKDNWEKRDGNVIRTIEKIKDLFEISIVSLPAYEATELTKRNFEEFIHSDDVQDNEEQVEAINENSTNEVEAEDEPSDESNVFPQNLLKYI